MAIFSVIISEKGGAERRESFERGEVNVGRVQGNEIMLPKGNVSKRHARILFRDGRFIVTDLKSTNGTYVNGRKIAQATIVREGDKIYVGDFILRIEAASDAGGSKAPPSPYDDSSARIAAALEAGGSHGPSQPLDDGSPSDLQSKPPPPPLEVAIPPFPAPSPAPVIGAAADFPTPDRPVLEGAPGLARDPSPSSVSRPSHPSNPAAPASPASGPRNLRPISPIIESKSSEPYGDVISHFPLEHDPDESMQFAVPAAPRMPSAPKPFVKTLPVAGIATGPQSLGASSTSGGSQTPASSTSSLAASAPGRSQPVLGPTAPADVATPFTVPALTMPAPAPTAMPAPAPHRVVLPPPIVSGNAGREGGTAPELERRPTPNPGGKIDKATSPSFGVPVTVAPAGPDPGAHETGRPARDSRPRSLPVEEVTRLAARQAALAALLVRVRDLAEASSASLSALVPDEATVARLERALLEASVGLVDRRDTDSEEIVAAARRELFELGALGRVFEGGDVTEIQVLRHDDVVMLHDRRRLGSDVGFSSDDATGMALRRLCVTAGRPLESDEVIVERRLPGGARLFALLPSMVGERAHVVVVRRSARVEASLDDIVRSGIVSRGMATFLGQCVAARARILVTSALGGGGVTVLGALAFAAAPTDRAVVLQGEDEITLDLPHVVTLLLGSTADEATRAMRTTARLVPDRLIISAFRGAVVGELAIALGAGVEGVLALAHGPTLRHVTRRLAADLAGARQGQPASVVRDELASSFDLAVEVARLPDGRLRVLRLAELDTDPTSGVSITRDIFTFTIERTAAGGAVEGSFTATGVVPRVADELTARGIPIDTAIFRRHARGDAELSPARPTDAPRTEMPGALGGASARGPTAPPSAS